MNFELRVVGVACRVILVITEFEVQLVAGLLIGNPMSLSRSWVGHKPDSDQSMDTPSLRSFLFLTFFMKTFFFLFYFTENY